MPKYAYEDMSDDQFEQVVAAICRRVLGAATSRFAKGKDGGRDARFTGVATLIPSQASPWAGTTIVQAKHTEGINKSCSESDFFSKKGKSSVVVKELERIKSLRASGELDHYMMFTNRRTTALASTQIVEHISFECGVPKSSILLCGIEQIEDWMQDYPDIADSLDIDPIDYPLKVDPAELAQIVEAFSADRDIFSLAPDFIRVSLKKKNEINAMSEEYSDNLSSKYLKYTDVVREFLAAPANSEHLRAYEEAAEDFQLNVIAKRKDYQSFDAVMNRIRELLFARNPVLSRNKRATGLILFYMYWNCDLGLKVEDASTV